MSPATLGRSARKLKLTEEHLGVVRIDGARHSLIWTHDEVRSVSVLLDRPDQGSEKLTRLLGAFWPDEGFETIETLVADFEEHYVKRPRAGRIPPRPLESADLAPRTKQAARRPEVEGPCIVCGHRTADKSHGGGSHGTRPYWHWRCRDGEECAVRRNAGKRRPRPESEVRAEWRARR